MDEIDEALVICPSRDLMEQCFKIGGLCNNHGCLCEGGQWGSCPQAQGVFIHLNDLDSAVASCYCPGTFAEARKKGRNTKVSAMRFCQTLADYASFEAMRDQRGAKSFQHRLREGVRFSAALISSKLSTAQERCQAALTHANFMGDDWANGGSELISPGRLGRIESSLHWTLSKVCKDECVELLKEMEKQREDVALDISRATRSAQPEWWQRLRVNSWAAANSAAAGMRNVAVCGGHSLTKPARKRGKRSVAGRTRSSKDLLENKCATVS